MPTFDIICLAKSTKHGGMCIAGIRTDGLGWFRPIANKKDGTLYPEHYTLEDGREPQVFDIIRIQCSRPQRRYHHPENWLIEPNKLWKIVGTPTLSQVQQLLNPEVIKHSSSAELLGNSDKRVCYNDLKLVAAESSLALIKPRELQWEINPEHKKYRANFSLGGTSYNFTITDPLWKSQLKYLEEGIYSCEEVIEKLELENYDCNNFLLTISLGEPFSPTETEEEFCYKLVAAVINVADIKKSFGWI
ncbi:hypothetical protein H6G93_15520 [Nostoc sp. FACHB-973]|nr:hypothetical protein [Nostoc sp. FACHB-973]